MFFFFRWKDAEFLILFSLLENFHSVLEDRTKETDTAEQNSLKAKKIDPCKHELHLFKSIFVPPKNLNCSKKIIHQLKVKAAEFLLQKFEMIHINPGMAVML